MMTFALLVLLGVSLPPDSPQAAVDGLLAADRQFAAAASKLDATSGISAMFADDVAMLAPGGFANGKAKAIEALNSNPDNPKSRAEWTPVRGGVSADGQQGFTFGYMVLHKPDGTRTPVKYLAYWVRKPEGWRVAVYKRGRAETAPAAIDPMPPAVPARLVPPTIDAAAIAAHRDSLDRAERAFSDEAQKIGLGPAFAKHGSADAVNMGPPTEARFVVGSDAIGRNIGASAPGPGSPLNWAPDRVIVASSGDLGVTIGTLRRNNPPAAGQPATTPFITVWRRPTPADPWKYVAE